MLLYEDLTYQIRKACFNVFNSLGFGHKEVIYQRALAEEFEALNLPYEKEAGLDVYYKGRIVGKYIPDFIIDHKVIVEIKSTSFILKEFEKQLLYYLKNTNFKLGLIVNFGAPKLSIKRLILTESV